MSSPNTVSTLVKMEGAAEVLAAQQKIYEQSQKLAAAGRRSVAIADGIAKKQKDVAHSADQSAKATSGLASKFGSLAAANGLLAGSFGQAIGAMNSMGPVLEAVEAKFTTVNKHGTRLRSGMGELAAQTSDAIGKWAGWAAVGIVAAQAFSSIVDRINDVNGVAAQHNVIVDAMASSHLRLIELEIKWGREFKSRSEAMKFDREETVRLADAQVALTDTILRGAASTREHLAALAEMGSQVAHMSDVQLVRYKAALEADTAALYGTVDAADALTQKLFDQIAAANAAADAIGKQADAAARSVEKYERGYKAIDKLTDASLAFADELTSIRDASDLTDAGFEKVIARAADLQKEGSRLGVTLRDDVAMELKRLGVNLDEVVGALDNAAKSGAGLRESMQGGFGSYNVGESTKRLADEAKKQAERWKKEAEERAALEKVQIEGLADHIRDKFGVAFTDSMVVFNNQFGTVVENAAEVMKAQLAQISTALTNASAQPSRSGSERANAFTSSIQGQVAQGGRAAAEAIERLEKQVKLKEDELRVIETRFSRRGNYKSEHQKRVDELADLKSALREAMGEGQSSGDRAQGRFSALKDDGRTLHERELERKVERLAQANEETAREVRRGNSRIEAATLATGEATKEAVAVLRKGNEIAADSGKTLGKMAGGTRTPSTFDLAKGSGRGSGGGGGLLSKGA